MDTLLADIRFSFRQFRKHQRFTILAVVVLALGIGANAAIFSIINGLILRPLSFDPAHQLAAIWETVPNFAPKAFASIRDYEEMRQHANSVEDMAIYRWLDYTLTGAGEPQKLSPGVLVSGNFFSMLGVKAEFGRTFQPNEARGMPLVVLSHAGWQQYFGGSLDALGKSIILDGVAHQIVGVMPSSFSFYPRQTAMWVLMTDSNNAPVKDQRAHAVAAVAKLKPGMTHTQAAAELTNIRRGLEDRDPDEVRNAKVLVNDLQEEFAWLGGNIRPALLILQIACLAVLLVACINLAGLTLIRSNERMLEISVRSALGATRPRLIRQLLTESVMLALIGCGFGALVAYGLIKFFVARTPIDLPPGNPIVLDGRVMIVMVAVAILTGGLFGLLPAWKTSGSDPADYLRTAGRSNIGNRRSQWVQNGLTVIEVALTLTLLVAAVSLSLSFYRLQETPLGYNLDHLLSFRLDLPDARYSDSPQVQNFLSELTTRLRTLPQAQVTAAGTSGSLSPTTVVGKPVPRSEEYLRSARTAVLPDYFQTLGLRLIRGRSFAETDRSDTVGVVIVNEELARRLFQGEDPLNQRIRWGNPTAPNAKEYEIIGIVSNKKRLDIFNEMAWKTEPEIFIPYSQAPVNLARFLEVFVRTPSSLEQVGPAIRAEVQRLDSSLPVYRLHTMREWLSDQVKRPRFRAQLIGAFAVLTILLTGVGLYAVITQLVLMRSREIGLRLALGATPWQIARSILRRGTILTILGIAIGLIGATSALRLLRSFLFGLDTLGVEGFLAATVILTLIALAATALPAIRAARISPAESLRLE